MNIQVQLKYFLLIPLLYSALGCDIDVPRIKEPSSTDETLSTTQPSKDTSFNSDDSTAPKDDTKLEPVTLPGDLGTTLVGNWSSRCMDDYQWIYSFSTTQWIQGVLVYKEGSNCKDDLLASAIFGGTFKVEDITEDGIVNWNGHILSYPRTFYSQDLVDYYNEIKLHGYDDWEVGVPKECIEKPSEPGKSYITSRTVYASLQISEDNELGFGPFSLSAESRDSTIDWSGDDHGPFLKK